MAKKEIRWGGLPLEEELEAMRQRDRQLLREPMRAAREIALGKKLAEAFDKAGAEKSNVTDLKAAQR